MQGEFELDRLDYLETIRKQDQQLKLLHQILERVHPIIRKDSNYADIARIKRFAFKEGFFYCDASNVFAKLPLN